MNSPTLHYEPIQPRTRWRLGEAWSVLAIMGEWIAGFLLLAGGVSLFIGIFGSFIGPIISYPIPIFMAFLVTVGAAAMRMVRRRRATAVLVYLQQAVRLQAPLDRFLLAAQYAERGKLSRRLWELRDMLTGGASLAAAMESAVPEVSPRALGLIAAAERDGSLPATLQRLIDEDRFAQTRGSSDIARLYPTMLIGLILTLTVFVAIFIAPRLMAILRDFRIPVQKYYLYLNILSSPFVLILIAPVAVIVIAIVGGCMREIFFGGRRRPGFLAGIRDRIFWKIPGLRGLARDRQLGDACFVMASALQSGAPLQTALGDALALENGPALRDRLMRWGQAMQVGQSPHEAARLAGLPPLMSGLIATAESTTAMPDALMFLGRYYSSRFSRAMTLLRSALIPAGTILMGLMTLGIALSLFEPLLILIKKLTDTYPGAM